MEKPSELYSTLDHGAVDVQHAGGAFPDFEPRDDYSFAKRRAVLHE